MQVSSFLTTVLPWKLSKVTKEKNGGESEFWLLLKSLQDVGVFPQSEKASLFRVLRCGDGRWLKVRQSRKAERRVYPRHVRRGVHHALAVRNGLVPACSNPIFSRLCEVSLEIRYTGTPFS